MTIQERYEKALQALHERCKDMHPLANIAAQDKEGNYLIPEYKEYLEAYTQYAYQPASDEVKSYQYNMTQNAAYRDSHDQ